jgi:DNA-binding MarR family transcriptional regulator
VSSADRYERPGDRFREPQASLREFLPFLLRESGRAADGAISAELREHGADWPTFAVLLVLDRIGGLSQETLASRAGIDRTTVSRLLPHLEEEGLVVRDRDFEDGRKMRVRPEQGCTATVHLLRGAVRSAEVTAFARLDRRERDRLRVLLQRSLPPQRDALAWLIG